MRFRTNIYKGIAVFMFCLSLAGPMMQSMFDPGIYMVLAEEIDFGSKEKEKETKDKEKEVKHIQITASLAFGSLSNVQNLALIANQLKAGDDYSQIPDQPPKSA